MPKKERVNPGSWHVSDTQEGRVQDWVQQWDKGCWDFLYTQPGPMLERHFDRMTDGKKGLKILVPLAATTYDLIWLHNKGHVVVGTDLAESAAQRIFKQIKQEPVIEDVPSINGKLYKNSSGTLKYYVGDFLKFSPDLETNFDFILDSKALCAIDERDRDIYLKVQRSVMGPKCSLMLEFPKKNLGRAPYHFTKEEVTNIFGDICNVEYLGDSTFDLTKAFFGDIDDEGKPIVEEEKEEEKSRDQGEEKKTVFVLDCYSVKNKNW